MTKSKGRVKYKPSSKKWFIVREMYLRIKATTLVGYRVMWKLERPLQIKIILWRNGTLTKENLLKRG